MSDQKFCPECKGSLKEREGTLFCANCGDHYDTRGFEGSKTPMPKGTLPARVGDAPTCHNCRASMTRGDNVWKCPSCDTQYGLG